MSAILLEAQATRLRITVYGLLTLAVMGCIGAAAVKADDHYRAEAMINQEATATWK
jgi:hypothetical protein